MKISLLNVGDVPAPLRDRFGAYMPMFHRLLSRIDETLSFETFDIAQGASFPGLSEIEALIIPGSPAGVYDDLPWMDPLRQFIRDAYDAQTPMVGVCFGHQIMADALGGDVRKSAKGWGLGRHAYAVADGTLARNYFGATAAIAASHQDQVIAAPPNASTYLSSEFTPNAGLIYNNGAALSLQPHPEFETPYSKALCDLRLGKGFNQQRVDKAKSTLDEPMDNLDAARMIVDYLKAAR